MFLLSPFIPIYHQLLLSSLLPLFSVTRILPTLLVKLFDLISALRLYILRSQVNKSFEVVYAQTAYASLKQADFVGRPHF